MHRLPAIVLAAAAALAAPPALAQERAGAAGVVVTASVGGGGELGLDEGDGEGKAGLLEAEVAAGLEAKDLGLRGELAMAFGIAPDGHVAFRPGIRWRLPETPFSLRVALDGSNARDHHLRWRWLLVGLAAEIRFTSLLGLYGEVDSGAPLAGDAGLPLLFRGGATFRF